MVSFFQLREDLEKQGMILVNFAAHLRELHEDEGGPLEVLCRIETQHWAFAHLFKEIIQVWGWGSFPFI